eukprot:COSAG05_NODE_5037_length_1282_cov_23.734573_1_plen_106_part_00
MANRCAELDMCASPSKRCISIAGHCSSLQMRLVRAQGRIGVAIHFSAVLLHQLVFKRWASDEVAVALSQEPSNSKTAPSQDEQASTAALDLLNNGQAMSTTGTMV